MPASDVPEREPDDDDRNRRVPPPRPPDELPVESTDDAVDDEAMRRADAANGEPDASE